MQSKAVVVLRVQLREEENESSQDDRHHCSNCIASDPRKDVNVRQRHQRLGTLRSSLRPNDFLVVEQDPTLFVAHPDVRHVMPRVNRRSLVRDEGLEAVLGGERRRAGKHFRSWRRGSPSDGGSIVPLVVRMVEDPLDGATDIATLRKKASAVALRQSCEKNARFREEPCEPVLR